MANKTLVSIDDMIKEYRSAYDFAAKRVQKLVDNIHIDSFNAFDLHATDNFRSTVDDFTFYLPGMVYLIYAISGDEEFFKVEIDRVSDLSHDSVKVFSDCKQAYLKNLLKGESEACQNV